MEFLSYQSWLILAALTLTSLLTIRIQSWDAVEFTSRRRRRELEILCEPTGAVVECVFSS
jgi:hypothetical protein